MEQEIDNEAGAAPVHEEEAAAFRRLEVMAAEGEPEAGAPGAPGEQEPAPAVDAAESLAGFLTMAGALPGLFGFPRAAAVWSEPVCEQVAQKTVPVLRKYPWGQRFLAFFESGAGAEELALGALLFPLGFATVKAVRADLAAASEEAAAEQNKPGAPVMREVHDLGAGHAD